MTAGAVFVVLLALQDSELRSKRPAGWLAALPPVESLERALFSVISIGTAALTLAIVVNCIGLISDARGKVLRGAGKSELALRLDEQLDAEIVNADSMQVYRGMDIGTAKDKRARLVDVCDITEHFDVKRFV